MRILFAMIGMAAVGAVLLPAMAQGGPAETAEPAPAAPGPVEQALDGFHVIVLQDAEGSVASARNDAGEDALLAFIDPEAATAASADAAISDMQPGTVPLVTVLSTWEGSVIFESGPAEREHAAGLVDEEGQSFLAPAYFVTTGGQETQIQAQGQVMTPVLLSYDDAAEMAARLKRDGVAEETIKIVPIELSGVLQQINMMETDRGYRLFTHPATVAFIQSMQAAAGEEQE